MNGIAKNRNSICHIECVSIRMPESHMGGVKASFDCKKRTLRNKCRQYDSFMLSFFFVFFRMTYSVVLDSYNEINNILPEVKI